MKYSFPINLTGILICFSRRAQKWILLFCFLLYNYSLSQNYRESIFDVTTGEKIYLQLSSDVFALDQDIWFKAIVTNAENHRPTKISGVLYVDLINPNEQIVDHKLVKLENGIGQGSFELQKKYLQGRYLIRAYTQWNRNFGEDFQFKTYVNLLSATKEERKNPIENLAIVEKDQGKYFLTGELWPQRMGGHAQKKIKVYMDWGVGKDSLRIKSKHKEVHFLEYELPKALDWLNVTLDNEDGYRHTERIVFNESPLDVQFFPESGKLIHGFLNKIGFKAVGVDGKGRKVQGEVFNAREKKVAAFESNHLGMGVFYLKSDSKTTYYSKVSLANNIDSTLQYSLPKVVQNGSILSVARTRDKIKTTVTSNELKDSVSVKISCRGKDYYLIEGLLKEGSLNFELPSNKLPEGIVVFTLFNEQKIPVAERLYFNETDVNRLNITLETDKDAYVQRAETKLDIKLSGRGAAPSTTDISVQVINKDHWYQGMGQNIRSYFLLDSELRGEVEEPNFYFKEENPDRFNDLDALLLTQGWRDYKFPVKRQNTSFYWPQAGLTVKGIVRSAFSKRKSVKNVDLTLATFGQSPSFYVQPADSLGKFHFLLDDAYGQRMKILLQAKNGLNQKTNYTISLDSFSKPKIIYDYKSHIQKRSSVVQAVVNAEQRRNKTRAKFDFSGINELEEVVVEGSHLTEEQRKADKEYGKPDLVISGDDIRKKEKKWSYGLYSILLFNYGDQIQIESFSDGFMLAHIIGGHDEPTLLVVDGQLLQKYEYEYLPHMSPEIVKSVQLIKYAKFFKTKYLTVFPETNPLEAPYMGHIISIFTKGRVGVYGRPSRGKLDTTIDIFSPIKEFYAPQYDKPIPANTQKPDLRSLVHWAPTVSVDHEGNASVDFYNGDLPGNYVIVVEAISQDGRIGYREKMYRVMEKSP